MSKKVSKDLAVKSPKRVLRQVQDILGYTRSVEGEVLVSTVGELVRRSTIEHFLRLEIEKMKLE